MTDTNTTPAGAAMELLPCPFCGGEAKLVERRHAEAYVLCVKCGAVSDECSRAMSAIAAWNRRTASAQHEQLQQRIEALERELAEAQVGHVTTAAAIVYDLLFEEDGEDSDDEQ